MIYTEGTDATNLYIIYEGQFRLKKKNLSEKNERNNNYISKENFYSSDVAKHHVVLNLTNGDFAGLEAFMNYDYTHNMMKHGTQTKLISETSNMNINDKIRNNNSQRNSLLNGEKNKYKNSLTAENEYNVIFSLNPNLLTTDLRHEFYEFLKPIFERREKFILEIFKNHQVIKEKMSISYREKMITNISKNNNKKVLDKIDQIGTNDNYIKNIIKPLHFEEIGKENKFIKFHSNNTIRNSDKNCTKNSSKHLNTDREVQREKIELTTSNYKPTTEASPKSDMQNYENIFTANSRNSKKPKVSLFSYPTKSSNSPRQKKRFTIDINSFDQNLFINEKTPIKKPIISLNTLSTIDRKESVLERVSRNLMNTLKEENIRSTIRENTVDSNYTKNRIKLKIISNKEKEMKKNKDIGRYVHKYVAKTINNWNKINKNDKIDYSSGDFNLPLVTRISVNRDKDDGRS